MVSPGQNLPSVSIAFLEPVWDEEVRRFDERSPARLQAERARKEIEAGETALNWRRCESEGADRTSLPGCRKLYVPLGQEGASSAPYGFVFRLTQNEGGRLSWNMIAFGERHPDNTATRSVYARAHKRLHGRYPE